MAKIDTSVIEGYGNMSAEEKLAILEAYDIPEQIQQTDGEVTKLRKALSNANSDAAEWKRKFRETQSEAERVAAEKAENELAMKSELETLKKEKTISNFKAQFLANGYGTDLAESSALAMADGDNATVFANLKTFLEERTKSIQAEALKRQPELTPGSNPSPEMIEQQQMDKLRKYAGLL